MTVAAILASENMVVDVKSDYT